jgi:hypothetical protein
MIINHNYFKEELYKITKKSFDIVSTIDHPYVSPPIRLIDGHNRLRLLKKKNFDPLILIWDVNYPNIERHRYELSFDAGILANKRDDFFVFSNRELYPLQEPRCIDFQELKKRLELVLERMQGLRKKERIIRNKEFMNNFSRIAVLYSKIIKERPNGTDFYRKLIGKLYKLIGLTELSDFFIDSSVGFFNSSFIKKWIPFCINSTKGKPYGLLNLLDHDLFNQPYFRGTNVDGLQDVSDSKYISDNIDLIIKGLSRGEIIPSYEIFFWTLSLADIKHYGNDYDFFNKLNKLNHEFKLGFGGKIQLTKHNDDSRFMVLFEEDRSFSCFKQNGTYVIKKNNPAINYRISSLTAVYCHLGERLNTILEKILSGKLKIPKMIKMGELNLS